MIVKIRRAKPVQSPDYKQIRARIIARFKRALDYLAKRDGGPNG